MDAAMPDAVEVAEADLTDKTVIRRLLELHAHDHSEFDSKEINDHGEFGYRYLGHHWTEPDRHPFLVRSGGCIAGFFVSGLHATDEGEVRGSAGAAYSMSEFFVLRRHRRRGVGLLAAHALFRQFPGPWRVRQTPGNEPATSFWRAVVPPPFTEEITDDGIIQYFTARVEADDQ